MQRLELPLSDDDWPFVDTISCSDILDPASGARDEALRRLHEYGAVVFRDVASPAHCREMRRDMWRHVETIAPGFCRSNPATWEAWTKRGNYGMPGKKTIFTPPFLALRQSERVAACFAALMEERVEDLVASHDRWLLCVESVVCSADLFCYSKIVRCCGPTHPRSKNEDNKNSTIPSSPSACRYLKTSEAAGSSSAFKTRRNIHLDLTPWEYVESDPRVFADLEQLTYASTRDFTRELNTGHAAVGPELRASSSSSSSAAVAVGAHAAGGAPRRAGGLSLQGLVNLRDNRPDDGGTLVVPRPPAAFEAWLAKQPTTQRTRGAMQFAVSDDDPLWANAQRVRAWRLRRE